MKKRVIILSLILLLTVSFAKLEIPEPTSEFFVNDFANVINESDEEEIFNTAKALYESSGNSTQVVVVTVGSLQGYSIEEYANELFNKWLIGSKKHNDGVLILLSVGDRESRIEVGYGLEGILTDAGTGKIQDNYMLPYYKNNDFSRGLVNGTKAICNVINGDLIIENNNYNEAETSVGSKKQGDNDFTFFLIGVLVSIPIYISLYKFRLLITSGAGVIAYVGSKLLFPDFIVWIFLGIFFVGVYFVDGFSGRRSGRGYSGGGFSSGGFSGGGGRSGGGGSSRSF